MHVLLVDDSADNRQLCTFYLTKLKATVDFAENGEEGIQYALNHDYDVVLMDVEMPILDGLEATRQLRSKGYQVPIIALTSHRPEDIKKNCVDAGYTGVLAKPFSLQKFDEIISKYLS